MTVLLCLVRQHAYICMVHYGPGLEQFICYTRPCTDQPKFFEPVMEVSNLRDRSVNCSHCSSTAGEQQQYAKNVPGLKQLLVAKSITIGLPEIVVLIGLIQYATHVSQSCITHNTSACASSLPMLCYMSELRHCSTRGCANAWSMQTMHCTF